MEFCEGAYFNKASFIKRNYVKGPVILRILWGGCFIKDIFMKGPEIGPNFVLIKPYKG